ADTVLPDQPSAPAEAIRRPSCESLEDAAVWHAWSSGGHMQARVRNVRTLRRTVDVEVGWPESAGEWFDPGERWFENTGWIWASIFVPLGFLATGWCHRMRRLKRRLRSRRAARRAH